MVVLAAAVVEDELAPEHETEASLPVVQFSLAGYVDEHVPAGVVGSFIDRLAQSDPNGDCPR